MIIFELNKLDEFNPMLIHNYLKDYRTWIDIAVDEDMLMERD
jgi:hypothetical protein